MTTRNPTTLMSISNDDTFDYLFKIVLIGDCGTGKTCVVQRFKTGNYVERFGTTIGVDFSMKSVSIDGKKVKLQLWDTAGMERFRTITQSYYRSAHAVMIVYDITKRSSFLNIQKWIEEVRRYTASNVILILIGNKCDKDTQREVELTEAEAMCQYIPEVLFVMETSAKENTNIEETFICLADELKRRNDPLSCGEHLMDGVQLGNSKPISKCMSSCSLV